MMERTQPSEPTENPAILNRKPDNNAAGATRSPEIDAGAGTYCPRCGFLVHFDMDRCPSCGHDIHHNPSKIQKYGLLSGMGFIILGGVFVFLQPRAYHTFKQDLFECCIILCVVGAGISFFTAVVDMIRRGGE